MLERESRHDWTARPRPLSDEIVAPAGDESGDSLEPEDLGRHFLREAIEQGDPIGGEIAWRERSDLDDFDPADAPSSEAELAAWARWAQLAAESGGSRQLQAAAELAAGALAAKRGSRRRTEPRGDVRLIDSIIREASLLDHEGAELDEVVAPRVDADDQGRHSHALHGAPHFPRG